MTDGWNPLADSTIGQDRMKRLVDDAGKQPLGRRYGGPHYVVIHITGGSSFDNANTRFIDVVENVSPHYCLKTNGDIIQYVKDEHGANHAGIRPFIIDAYKDGTWRKWKRNNTGVAVRSRLSEGAPITNSGVYSKRTDGKDWPSYEVQERCARARIGNDISLPYIPVPTNAAGDPVTTGDQTYLVNRNCIGIEIVAGGARAITASQYAALIQLLGDLCARHGIPYDAKHIVGHEDVNPCDRFGWDPGCAEGIYQLFDWKKVFEGGDWKLPDGPPPVLQPRGFSLTRFPIGEGAKSPLTAYFENEGSFGGFFPLGLRANVHSGIHVYPPPPPPPEPGSSGTVNPKTGVHAMLPGWVVAARLAQPSDATLISGAHRGFVLLRHEFLERDAEGKPTGDPQAFYSLYMHLSPPALGWDWKPGAEPYAKAWWLQELLETGHGSVVIANAENQEAGAQYWLTEAPPAGELKGTLQIADPTNTEPSVPLVLTGEGVLALRREQPADAAQTLRELKSGHTVTFNAPFLKVCAGDLIGYVEPVEDFEKFPTGFLHWEVLAKADEGLKKLLELAASGLGLDAAFFASIANDQDDNTWSKKELNDAFTPVLPQADQDALTEQSQELFPSACNEGTLLWMQHHQAPLSFADQAVDHGQWTGRADKPEPPDEDDEPAPRPVEEVADRYPHAALELTYPLTLRLENTLETLDASSQQLRFKVTFEPEGLGEGIVDLTALSAAGDLDTSGEVWEIKIQVPAAAERVILHPQGDLHVDTGTTEVDIAKDLGKASFETLLPHRWRHVRLTQVSPWSLKAMRKQVEARFDAKIVDRLVPAYGALAWWALGTGEPAAKEDEVGKVARDPTWKEVPVLGKEGEEKSIFGDLLPDADGKIDNVHPVTAGWAINALVEHKKIELVEDWAPVAAAGEDDPLAPTHAGWVAPGGLANKQMGDEITVLVVAKGYASSAAGKEHELKLLIENKDKKTYTLGSYPYVRGVVQRTFPAPLWGDWTLKVDGHDTIDGNELPTELSIPRPSTAGCDEPSSDNGLVRWTLRLTDPRPALLQGWIMFSYWEGKEDDIACGAPTYAKHGIPVNLGQVPPEPACTAPGITLDDTGQYITGKSPDGRVPDSDSSYTFGTYDGIQSGGGFKLAIALGRMVDTIRGRVSGLHFHSLNPDGLTIKFKRYQPTPAKTTALKTVIENLHEQGGFRWTQDGDWFEITLDAPGAGASGPCVVTFRPGPVLSKLLEEHQPAEGNVFKVAYGFVAPNGGRGVLKEGDDAELVPCVSREETGEDDVPVDPAYVEVDLEKLRTDLGDDNVFEVWGGANLPLAPLGFQSIEHRVEGEDLVLSAAFSRIARPADFAAAVPRFMWDGKEFGDCVANDLELVGQIKLTDLYANGADKVTIEAKLTGTPTAFDGVEQEVPAKTAEVPAQPKLHDMKVLFGNGTARATCVADSWPTGKVVDMQIYREDDTPVAALKRYVGFDSPWSGRRGSGFVDNYGNVGASISWGYLRTAFEVGDTVKFKILRVSSNGKVFDVTVDAAEFSIALPSEDDARKPFDEEGAS